MASGGVLSKSTFEDANIIPNSISEATSVLTPNSSVEIRNNSNQPTTNVELVRSLSNEYAGLIDIHCGKEVSVFIQIYI